MTYTIGVTNTRPLTVGVILTVTIQTDFGLASLHSLTVELELASGRSAEYGQQVVILGSAAEIIFEIKTGYHLDWTIFLGVPMAATDGPKDVCLPVITKG